MGRSVGVFSAVALLVVCCTQSAAQEVCNPTGARFECGYLGITQEQCEAKRCCWSPSLPVSEHRKVDLPWCFTSNAGTSTYDLKENTKSSSISGAVYLEGKLKLVNSTQPELGADIPELGLSVQSVSRDILRFKIGDANAKRWEVPPSLFGRTEFTPSASSNQLSEFNVSHSTSPFSLAISRGNNVLVATDASRLVFKPQFLEITTLIPQDASLYGLGEHTVSTGLRLPRDGLPITLWNRDISCSNPDTNLYGSHPFVMAVREDGTTFGMVLLNSNGMEVVLTEQGIVWRTIGGVLDFYILSGPTPADVMNQLTRLFGRPHMPPYWALGFHQCKWGYKSIEEVEEVVDNYTASGIPLEAMWTDIDYMDKWKDFTVDPVAYPMDKFRAFVDKLHARRQKFVPIVDPGIKVEPGDAAYDDGIKRDVFLKDVLGKPYVGQVWPGAVHYPDFAHPESQAWWYQHLKEFHKQLPFDGLWIDMNEASNFCTGEVCEVPSDADALANAHLGAMGQNFQDDPTVCFLKCQTTVNALNGSLADDHLLNNVDRPPYAISNGNLRLSLGDHALAMSVSHHDGELQYNTHQLYGLQQGQVSHLVMAEVTGGRPFILSRSTFLGGGQYAAHWTGDNFATFEDLRASIPSILNSGMFGIPFVGADICGFNGVTTEELCGRWIEAGAFYPFSRDHSGAFEGYQELYQWESVADAGRRALNMRYQLLPFWYSEFYEAHKTGTPVARPLFFLAPEDPQARAVDEQWLLGDAIMVSPVMHEGATTVTAYFPRGIWYSLWDGENVDARNGGVAITLDAPLGRVPLHVRGGRIVPMQQPGMTTDEVRRSPLTLVVALIPQEEAALHPAWQRQLMQYLKRAVRKMPLARSPLLWTALQRLGMATRPAGPATAQGWMYHDQGNPLKVSDAPQNFLSFNAAVGEVLDQSIQSRGAVTIHHGRPAFGADDVANADCTTAPQWPLLHSIKVYGVHHQVDGESVHVEVADASSLPVARATDSRTFQRVSGTGSSINPVASSQVYHNAETGVLEVSGLGQNITCSRAVRVSWLSKGRPATAEL